MHGGSAEIQKQLLRLSNIGYLGTTYVVGIIKNYQRKKYEAVEFNDKSV